MSSSPTKAKTKKREGHYFDAVAFSFHLKRERVFDFSLEIHAIGPLDVDGAGRESVLRGAGYAWTPGLRVFDNSKRLDFLPTCVLFPFLRVFRCFGWFEAVRGRLIGPKTWDRIVRISWGFFSPSVTAQKLGAVWVF